MRRTGTLLLATGIGTLLLICFISIRDWTHFDSTQDRISKSRRVQALNQTLLLNLTDAETGQRGYLLTGREYWLAPYLAALEQEPGNLQELSALAAGDPEQLENIRQLREAAGQKLAELKTTIELRRSAGLKAALAVVETDQGHVLMKTIRTICGRIDATESGRGVAAWNDLQSWSRSFRMFNLAGVCLLAVQLAAAFLIVRRDATHLGKLAAAAKTLKEAAEHGRDLLRATLYSIGDGVIVTDASGAVKNMNSVAERLTGYLEAESRGEAIEDVFRIVHETSRTPVENPVRKALQARVAVALANHTVVIHRSGSELPIEDTAAPIAGPAGELAGAVLVFRDVSERKRATDLARRLATIVENSNDAIIGKTLEGVVTTWNRGAERIFGYSREEMIGQPISRLIPPDRADDLVQVLGRIRRGEVVDHFETVRQTRSGARLIVSLTVSPITDDYGRVVGASKILRDITEQKHFEERRAADLALRKSERDLRILADSVPNVIWTATPDGIPTYFNRRWYAVTGFSPAQDPREQQPDERLYLFDGEDVTQYQQAFEAARRMGEGFELQMRMRNAVDEPFQWHLIRVAPVFDDGVLTQWIGCATDIQTQKNSEAALEQAVSERTAQLEQALAEKTILLKEVHHRVKNNLTIISSLLARQAEVTKDPGGREGLEDSRRRLHAMALVHEHIYGGDRMDRVRFDIYIGQLSRQIYDSLHSRESIKLTVHTGVLDLGVHRAIPCALILNELLTNAMKYGFPENRAGEIEVRLASTGGRHTLTVRDDGVGLPPGFDWRKASSLGLRMVRILAKQLDGTVEVRSGPGTEITLEFPASAEAHSIPPAAAEDRIGVLSVGI